MYLNIDIFQYLCSFDTSKISNMHDVKIYIGAIYSPSDILLVTSASQFLVMNWVIRILVQEKIVRLQC